MISRRGFIGALAALAAAPVAAPLLPKAEPITLVDEQTIDFGWEAFDEDLIPFPRCNVGKCVVVRLPQRFLVHDPAVYVEQDIADRVVTFSIKAAG